MEVLNPGMRAAMSSCCEPESAWLAKVGIYVRPA
jgi:hypothetical protein